jgi:hypothetical protein
MIGMWTRKMWAGSPKSEVIPSDVIPKVTCLPVRRARSAPSQPEPG